ILNPRQAGRFPAGTPPTMIFGVEAALKSLRDVETGSITGFGHGDRRRARARAGAAKKKQWCARLIRVALEHLDHLLHELRIGRGGKKLPFAEQRLAAKRRQVRDADETPFCAGAHIDELARAFLRQPFPALFGGNIAGIFGGSRDRTGSGLTDHEMLSRVDKIPPQDGKTSSNQKYRFIGVLLRRDCYECAKASGILEFLPQCLRNYAA